MKIKLLTVSLAAFSALAFCQNSNPLDVHIKSISGPCAQIVGTKCYNPYETATEKWPLGEFGWYDFNDPAQKVTMVEKFDCSHPNKRVKWGSASPSHPDDKVSIYQSKTVKGLYESCYGAILADANGKCSHGLKAFSCDHGTCCP